MKHSLLNHKNYENLLHEYRKSELLIAMKLYQARQTRMKNRLQRYFNSTPLRNAFARWMCFASITNKFYTITELSNEMYTNRQSISKMVADCEAEKYIIVKRLGKNVSCQAAPILIEKMEDFIQWKKKINAEIANSYNNLINFEKLNTN